MNTERKQNNHGRNLIMLGVATILIASLGLAANEAFAMGQAPSTCNNRYDGTITAMKITVGHRTYDPIANPGTSFQLNNNRSYIVTFTIHMPSQSSQNETTNGTTWYDTNSLGYQMGTCVNNASPDQNITVTATEKHPANFAPQATQDVTWNTMASGNVAYTVNWVNP